MTRSLRFIFVLALSAAFSTAAPVMLSQTLAHGALTRVGDGSVAISGEADAPVAVNVTTSQGLSFSAVGAVSNHQFVLRYPVDFGAPKLEPGALFIDARPASGGGLDAAAEAAVIVFGPNGVDLPSAFTCGLIDAQGRTDRLSAQWPAVRSLVNLYLRSRGARLARVGKPDFDLARTNDLAWFKQNLTLYEFDFRDRDWTSPLGHRPRRAFWQSVWNTWFNSSNDHPIDGNPANRNHANYRPYAFANDFADTLIMYAMRRGAPHPLDDNLEQICDEAADNLMAMQHRESTNLALRDSRGRREQYTAGAFRYGLFENGDFMTEGTGWFYNPQFHDYEAGGVLNARSVWGLGETLKAFPRGRLAPRLRDSIALALRFCLADGAAGGYVKKTSQGRVYWRDPGEHAYLLLGMLAACEVSPDLLIPVSNAEKQTTLRQICIEALNALADLEKPHHQWSVYPNVDAIAIAALAQGAAVIPEAADAPRWRRTAMNVADAWMSATIDPRERSAPNAHFGLRVAPGRMTHIWSKGGKARIFYYQTGHWIHALADLYALSREPRYRDRAEALVRYLCGENPFRARLLTEIGGVYNWTDDTDGDGVEDLMKQDMYPESTAFCQIGIMRLIRAINQ